MDTALMKTWAKDYDLIYEINRNALRYDCEWQTLYIRKTKGGYRASVNKPKTVWLRAVRNGTEVDWFKE